MSLTEFTDAKQVMLDTMQMNMVVCEDKNPILLNAVYRFYRLALVCNDIDKLRAIEDRYTKLIFNR